MTQSNDAMTPPGAEGTNPATWPLAKAAEDIEVLVRARYPLVAVLSWEEERVLNNLLAIAERLGKSLYEWSITRGLLRHRANLSSKAEGKRGTKDPIVALREIMDITEPAIVVLKDYHLFLNDASVKRGLRDLASSLRFTYTSVVILSPPFTIPQELEKDLTIIDFPLPSLEELEDLLGRIETEVAEAPEYEITREEKGRRQLLEAALGLTLSEAENVFAKALVKTSKLTAEEVPFIFSEKRQIIRKSGLDRKSVV